MDKVEQIKLVRSSLLDQFPQLPFPSIIVEVAQAPIEFELGLSFSGLLLLLFPEGRWVGVEIENANSNSAPNWVGVVVGTEHGN